MITNLVELLRGHTLRIKNAILKEYSDEYYYFYKESSVPFRSTVVIDSESYPSPLWVYSKSKQSFYDWTSFQTQVVEEGTRHRGHGMRFPWISATFEDESGEHSECCIGFFTGLRYYGKPPHPSVLTTTYMIENNMIGSIENIYLSVIHSNGTIYRCNCVEGYPNSTYGWFYNPYNSEEKETEKGEQEERDAKALEQLRQIERETAERNELRRRRPTNTSPDT